MNRPITQSDVAPGARGAAGLLRVVGCGNPWAGDDSVGLEIVCRLRSRGDCGCELLELPQAGVELMDLLDGGGTVLFIDAVASGAPPGTLHLVPLPSPAIDSRPLGSLSSHGWGLAETLRLRTALGRPSPRLLLVGIEIEAAFPGGTRSPAVEDAMGMVVERFPVLCAMAQARENSAWKSLRRFAPGDVSFPGCNAEGGP